MYLNFIHDSWLTASKTFSISCDKGLNSVIHYFNEVTFGKPLG